MTNLELVLKEEGLLDGLLKRAQEVGMTLVDYLRSASEAAPAPKRGDVATMEELDPVMAALWARMMSDKEYRDQVIYAPAPGDDDLLRGEEARELCQD